VSYHYSIDGERVEDEATQDPETVRAAVQMCRDAIAEAKARMVCPQCGGQVKPGWTVHPACVKAAS
jgi:hypothetical protein